MCTQNQLEHIKAAVLARASELFSAQLKQAVLYGSYARGTQDDESDVDILLLVDMPAEALREYRSAVSRLSSRFSLRHDVTVSLQLQDFETFEQYKDALPFYRNVMQEGVVLLAG